MTTICILSISFLMLYAPSYVPPCASFYAPLIIVLYSKVNLHILKLQWCLTLCNPMDCSPPDSSVPGTLQARTLEWVAIPPPGDLPDPGIEPRSLMSPTLAGGFFTTSAIRKILSNPSPSLKAKEPGALMPEGRRRWMS